MPRQRVAQNKIPQLFLKTKSLIFVLLFFGFIVHPSTAHANVGTPLMWLSALHLFVGNALIGIFEGLIICLLFKTELRASIAIMILANYISMAAGYFFLIPFLVDILSPAILDKAPLYNAPIFIWVMVLATFLCSIILEWPFCIWAMIKVPSKAWKAFLASFAAQAASYFCIAIIFYIPLSQVSLYSRLKIDPSLPSELGSDFSIYYISPDDGDLYRVNLDGSEPQKLGQLGEKDWATRLSIRRSEDSNYWDLWLGEAYTKKDKRLLVERFAMYDVTLKEESSIWMDYGSDFRPEDERDWEIWTGFWAFEGLRAENEKTGEDFKIAFETPFIQWRSRQPTVLPSNKVIYQLGDQIVVLDLESQRIGLITIGWTPVVVPNAKSQDDAEAGKSVKSPDDSATSSPPARE